MICRQFLPVANGTERQAAALAAELGAMGHPTQVVAGRFDPAWPQRERIGGVAVERLPSPRWRLVGTWRYLRALRRFLLEQGPRFDVLHVHFAKHSAAVAARVATRIERPVVCKAACAGPFGDLAAARRTLFPGRLLSGIRRLDRLICVSDEVAEEWVGAGFPRERIARIPNGVDTERFRPAGLEEKQAARAKLGLPPDAAIVLGVGRLAPQKGFDTLIRALGRIKAPNAPHLALAGEGPARAELQAMADQAGLASRTHFLGRVENIEEAYRAADLFVLSSRAEGMSNALLEAMASGLDVVAARVSGVGDLAREGETGLLAEPDSVESLTAALERWLSVEPGRFGSPARRLIEAEFSLRRVAKKTLMLYEETIAERG